MNHYPLWKYLLIAAVIFICGLYALPNIFGEDPAVQISPAYARDMKIDQALQETAEAELKNANISFIRVDRTPRQLLFRFKDTNTQLKASTVLKEALPKYVVAQNLASTTPDWLRALGAQAMYLGLDLRGGVHFLMQVDMETAIRQDEETYIGEMRTLFRENKLRYKGISRDVSGDGGILVSVADIEKRDQAKKLIEIEYDDLVITEINEGDEYRLHLAFTEKALIENRQKALEQNITTLRNRVNELGVSEPVIQRQGDERIVVQLPGVQDTARAKEILGATATLEFRLVADDDEKLGARSYKRRDGSPVMLKRRVIATGDQIVDAAATIDQRSGRPATVVRLDNKGAKRMLMITRKNVGKPMAVVFMEYHIKTKEVDGKPVTTRSKSEEVINVATIQEEFGKNFQVTGLTSSEANNLALLLRAGALKAPMEIIEERTIGPSLGQENINLGVLSIMLGFLAVMLFMWMRYKTFGMVANLALLMNVVILVALLSLLQATLTLPGMAGIVLTLGMAVDANVLIFEKIREEIANGNSPQNSIHVGYEKAFVTIFDANITTLIAALMLFGFGTGPIKGFAITLSLGIITSMFTAIMLSRGVINFLYGGKKLDKLSV
ncbi:preprotein translocase subunit SecD [Candidatus Thiomargarita nelsonii]|uniref:Protein translocase subunit SecD n=1 Tax=Candidatus Thiomargarita nelsonii TaxID=1003181 RepID=A0A0A6PPZ4_9GAMM|nr:preprotein translocase subunit SecD [Candidatus Thiomargarita nelsonii]